MTGNLCRITVRNAMFGGGFFEILTVTGYDAVWEPEAPAKRDVLRPVETEEPDTEVEVGYSKIALEPLVIEFQGCKERLTESDYVLFRYINDLHRSEGQEEFEFTDISENVTGKECGKSKSAIESSTRRINISLEKINAPIRLTYEREILYVRQQI